MDSLKCENPTSSSSPSFPDNEGTRGRSFPWKTLQICAESPLPILGVDYWPALPYSSNIQERSPSSAMSRSSSTTSLTYSPNIQGCSVLSSMTSISLTSIVLDSDSDQYNKVAASVSNSDENNKVDVEFPAASPSMLLKSISALDLTSESMPLPSTHPSPDLDGDGNNGDSPAQLPNPSPRSETQNPGFNLQFRPNCKGNRFQNRGHTNRRMYHRNGFNNWNGNRGPPFHPFGYPLNRQHGLMNGPERFPPPERPHFVSPLPAPVFDYGVYFGSTFQDVYTTPYYVPYIMNGFPTYPYYPQDKMNGAPMYRPSPSVTPHMQQDDVQLRNAILRQIEYYFSPENLGTDYYLKSKMDEHGWVSVHLIATFNRIKSLTQNTNLILEALQPSTIVEVQGDKIRRRGDWFRFKSVAWQA